MCGRYNLRATPAEVQEFFEVLRMPETDYRIRYNIAPTQAVPIIRQTANQTECVLARWGLIPFWSKDTTIGARMINARLETVAEKPAFRAAFKKRRCLVPASGYYEWKKLDKKTKQPYHIHKPDDGLFAFAGLWECWDKADRPIESFTIITTDASAPLAELHDRMPVILPKSSYGIWLDDDVPADALQDLLQQHDDELIADAVSSLVGNVKNETPECVKPIA